VLKIYLEAKKESGRTALDEEEFDFLAQKAAEKRAKEAQSKQFDADAAIEFKVAQVCVYFFQK
jgi:hypothetical protein